MAGGPTVQPLYVEYRSDFWTTLPQKRSRFLDLDRLSEEGVAAIRRLVETGVQYGIRGIYLIESGICSLRTVEP